MLDYSPSSIVSDDVRSGSLSDKLKGIRSLAGQIARGLKAGLSFRFRVDAFAQSSLFVIQWCGVLSIVLVAREFFGHFDFDVTEFVAAIAKTAHAFAPPLTYLYWFSTLWLFSLRELAKHNAVPTPGLVHVPFMSAWFVALVALATTSVEGGTRLGLSSWGHIVVCVVSLQRLILIQRVCARDHSTLARLMHSLRLAAHPVEEFLKRHAGDVAQTEPPNGPQDEECDELRRALTQRNIPREGCRFVDIDVTEFPPRARKALEVFEWEFSSYPFSLPKMRCEGPPDVVRLHHWAWTGLLDGLERRAASRDRDTQATP